MKWILEEIGFDRFFFCLPILCGKTNRQEVAG